MRFIFGPHENLLLTHPDMLLVAAQSLDVLGGVLNERNVNTVKVVVQCFATVYALLFRQLYVAPASSTVMLCAHVHGHDLSPDASIAVPSSNGTRYSMRKAKYSSSRGRSMPRAA